MQTATATITETAGNTTDHEYESFLRRINDRFRSNTRNGLDPVFTTDAAGLWEEYLASFPESERQYHNCNTCRHFIERFGGLAVIDYNGLTRPAVWDPDDSDDCHADAVAALSRIVRRAKVTGVFLCKELEWGRHVTGHWRHLHIDPPASMIFKHPLLTAGQAMAEKREDFKNVSRALGEFNLGHVRMAIELLKTDALYRSEKVTGPAQFLCELHEAIAVSKSRQNAIWRATATSPAGFCHPRSSMVGTLLEDIASGMSFTEVTRRFKDKMHPLQYQRPQAAPTAGNIAEAEKVIEKLGVARSLERRYARLEEIQTIWRPTEEPEPSGGGIFSHLRPKGSGAHETLGVIRGGSMTFDKFRRTVLPEAKSIVLLVPGIGNFAGILTATHSDAPAILQWDNEEQRNPFSWYLYHGGSPATRWGLVPGEWRKVNAVTLQPSLWQSGYEHHGNASVFILDGAKDSNDPNLCLFPEIMKSELRSIRSTIEAYSRSRKLTLKDEGSANGIVVSSSSDATVRVTTGSGLQTEYRIDRWD